MYHSYLSSLAGVQLSPEGNLSGVSVSLNVAATPGFQNIIERSLVCRCSSVHEVEGSKTVRALKPPLKMYTICTRFYNFTGMYKKRTFEDVDGFRALCHINFRNS